jgi:hypothetical protein
MKLTPRCSDYIHSTTLFKNVTMIYNNIQKLDFEYYVIQDLIRYTAAESSTDGYSISVIM